MNAAKLTMMSACCAVAIAGTPAVGQEQRPASPQADRSARLLRARLGPAPQKLLVTSTAFTAGDAIPVMFSDYGEHVSPPLAWAGVPSDTRSFAIVVEDPDTRPPLPVPYVHWVVFNLPAEMTSLPEAVPPTVYLGRDLSKARQGRTSRNTVGYFGPRPPAGDPPHRYHFQVFALDRTLWLTPGASAAELAAAMRGRVLADGELIGTFRR